MVHHRKANRIKNYDYSNSGYYFVTICTKNNKHYFGDVCNGKMVLNNNGEIVDKWWNWLSEQYNYCFLDEYQIMPDHFHGILIIDRENVGTSRNLSLPKKVKSLSELIGAFKTKSSAEIHKLGKSEFNWHRSFYDRIIRNEKELFETRKYIIQNPLKWELVKGVENNF
ncbi:MAG: transposase [Melioribacteraceae bacterium]|nr:transposase [Melioribacteraceae bacterium]